MSPLEPQPDPDQEQIKVIKQDKLYCYAWDIINGKGGGEYIYCLEEDYIYVYEQGVWRKIFDIEFLDKVETHIPHITKEPLHRKKQIIENFKHKKYLRLESFNTYPLINFENYMFDPVGNNVVSHKQEFYSTIRIPYKYDAAASCDIWIKTLNEILENNQEKISLIQEFFGYCLLPNNEQKKGLLFLGETDTGKSTIIDIFRELIGEQNCSNVPLQYLSNPQYTPLLINKMVNIDPEVNRNAVDYEREFKIITGGKNERVSCNQKHIPTFEFTPKCKIILSANIFPKITDHSSAFYQRLLLIPCERRFMEHEKDRMLHDKLRVELPGIFNWVMKGAQRLLKRGRFETYDFMRDAVEELENENNPVNSFFDEHIEVDVVGNVYIEKSELYDRYISWAVKTNNYKLNAARFAMCLYKRYSKQTPKSVRLSEGKRPYIWRNIRYVEFKSHYQQIDLPAAVSNTSDAKAVHVDVTPHGQTDIDWSN